MTNGKKRSVHEVRGVCQYYCFMGYEDVGSGCKKLPFHQITQHHIPEYNNLTRISHQMLPHVTIKIPPPTEILKQTFSEFQHN